MLSSSNVCYGYLYVVPNTNGVDVSHTNSVQKIEQSTPEEEIPQSTTNGIIKMKDAQEISATTSEDREDSSPGPMVIDPEECSASNVQQAEEDENPIDLQIRNVVTLFSCCCHVDLRRFTLASCHVVYERSKGVVVKQLKKPKCYVKIWSSGKVAIAGCQSEKDALTAARRVARLLQRVIGPRVRFASYRVTNIMATCRMPFGLRIDHMARDYPKEASYEPELTTGLVWKSITPKSTLRIHTTGSVTITGALSENDVITVMETLYPILLNYKTEKAENAAKDK